MTKLLIPLVGAHFHPPAKGILAGLPAGVALSLVPEPDNPWDANTVLVQLRGADIPETSYGRVNAEVEGMGSGIEELLAQDAIVLGHCAASDGKPLAKLQAGCGDKLSGTKEILLFLARQEIEEFGWSAKLTFLPDGSPAIEVLA